MAKLSYDDEEFQGRDRTRNKFSAKQLRREIRKGKAQTKTAWQDEEVE